VTSGALVDAVLAYQVMLTDRGVIPGWLLFIIEATVVGSVLAWQWDAHDTQRAVHPRPAAGSVPRYGTPPSGQMQTSPRPA
jgi:hypothetical protein